MYSWQTVRRRFTINATGITGLMDLIPLAVLGAGGAARHGAGHATVLAQETISRPTTARCHQLRHSFFWQERLR